MAETANGADVEVEEFTGELSDEAQDRMGDRILAFAPTVCCCCCKVAE